MTDRFQIGEVAIVQNTGTRRDGNECIVIGALTNRKIESGDWVLSYAVIFDGVHYAARPQHLRKKKPPRDDLKVTRWIDCPWHPKKETA